MPKAFLWAYQCLSWGVSNHALLVWRLGNAEKEKMNASVITIGKLALGCVFACCLASNLHAQTALLGSFNGDLNPVQSAPPDSIVQIAAESAGLTQMDPADVPLRGGTYWWVIPGGLALPAPCLPQDVSGVAIYQMAPGQYLLDETRGEVLVNPRRFGLQAQATSSTMAAALSAQADGVVNLIDMIQGIAANQQMRAASRSMSMAAGVPDFGDSGSGSGDGGTPDDYIIPRPDYGTNLWIAQVMVGGGYLTGIGSNTVADVKYEVQSTTDLTLQNWISEGFIFGSETTNWTPLSVAQNNRTNLFLRLKSWADSNDSGIPDWWWLQYFGQITNVDPTASAAGDGYSNLEKFQMGLNPTNYYNPNAPGGFFGCLDATGTNVLIEWSPSPGPVSYYVIQRGILNTNTGIYAFSQAGLVSSNATFFKDAGALANVNGLNNIYNLQAAYVGGGLTGTDIWYASWYADYGGYGPPYGPPLPGEVYAYAPPAGTNVLISWTPAQGQATNYIIELGIYDTNSGDYDFSQIATVNTNTTLFTNVGAINIANDWNSIYEVAAVYPGGGLSQPASSSIYTNPPPPTGFSATVDATGTNVLISWTPPQGVTVINYVLERGIYDPNTDNYTYSQIGTVGAGTTSFEDAGAITSDNSYYNAYRITAVYPGGGVSGLNYSYLAGPSSASPFTDNIHTTACLIRNAAGRWQLMFSGIPTNVQAIALNWYSYDYFGDFDPFADPELGYPFSVETDIPVSSLTNGVYVIPDYLATNAIANGFYNNLGGGWEAELAPADDRAADCGKWQSRQLIMSACCRTTNPPLRTAGSA